VLSGVGAAALAAAVSAAGEAGPTPGGARTDPNPGPFELRAGVVADPTRGALYLMNPRGGVDAVDVVAGELLWTTAEAARPLLLSGRSLLAQAEARDQPHVLRLVVLDADRGARLAEGGIALPAGVAASIADGLGTSFEAHARPDQGDALVSWRFSRRPVTGVAPGPEAVPGDFRADGALRVDLATGRAEAVSPQALLEAPAGSDALARLVESAAVPKGYWRAGDIVAATARAPGLVLKRWDLTTGKPLDDVDILAEELVAQLPSADGRYLLVSTRVEPDPAAGQPYLWSVHAVETGNAVTRMRSEVSAVPFCVLAARLVHEARPSGRRVDGTWVERPLRLRAVELATGAEVWSRPLRDTAYRGPFPPRGDIP
jgi:hypothetical protein